MTNSTGLVDNALYYKPEWYLIGDADNNLIAALYGLIAMATIWRLEDLAAVWLFQKKDRVSLSDVAAQVTFHSSTFWEVLRWIFTQPSGTRISRKASLGIAVRLLIYVVEFLVLFGSIPQTTFVREKQVSGTTEITFEEGRILVLSDTRSSYGLSLLACDRDNIELRGFTPTAIRQVCLTSSRSRDSIGFGQRVLSVLPEYTRSEPRFSANNFSEFYLLMSDDGIATFKIVALRSGTVYEISHSLTYRRDSVVNTTTMNVVGFQIPRSIYVQATKNLLLQEEKRGKPLFHCEEIPINSQTFNVVFCALTEDRSTGTIPLYLFRSIGTKKVNNSQNSPKYVGIRNDTAIYEQTNVILGEVNRPRLCVIPALILLAILVVLSVVSRIWLKGGNVTLQLWKWLSATLDTGNSENPVYVSRNKQDGTLNVFDA